MSLPKPYYQDDAVTLYHGDCREIVPLLEKIDTVITDPPYGINFPYYGYDDNRDNLVSLISYVIPKLLTLSPKTYILCGPTQIGLYPQPEWVCCVTWNTTGTFGKYGYNQWTPVLCYGKDITGFGNVNGVTKADTLRINGGAGVGFQRESCEKEHTCPKPLNLMKLVVNRFSIPMETVLDPFAGSGTTGRACKDLGRKCVMIEREERYCEIAAKRMRQEVLPL